jgi:hypothetical protein
MSAFTEGEWKDAVTNQIPTIRDRLLEASPGVHLGLRDISKQQRG